MITNNADKEEIFKIKVSLRKVFKDFDVKTQLKDVGSSFSGPNNKTACRAILEQIHNNLKALTEFYNQELVDFEA